MLLEARSPYQIRKYLLRVTLAPVISNIALRTLFRNTDTWPLKDDADPVCGWRKTEILETSSGAATNDTYGKLYILLRGLLTRFHRRMESLDVTFQLLNVDAENLYDYVGQTSFDRIEVRLINKF